MSRQYEVNTAFHDVILIYLLIVFNTLYNCIIERHQVDSSAWLAISQVVFTSSKSWTYQYKIVRLLDNRFYMYMYKFQECWYNQHLCHKC